MVDTTSNYGVIVRRKQLFLDHLTLEMASEFITVWWTPFETNWPLISGSALIVKKIEPRGCTKGI